MEELDGGLCRRIVSKSLSIKAKNRHEPREKIVALMFFVECKTVAILLVAGLKMRRGS